MYTLGLPACCSPHSSTNQSSGQNTFTGLDKLFFALSIILFVGALIASGLLFEKLGPCSFAIGGAGILVVILLTLGIYKRQIFDPAPNNTFKEPVSSNNTSDSTVVHYYGLDVENNRITEVLQDDPGEKGWFGPETTFYLAYLAMQHKEIEIKLQLSHDGKLEFLCFDLEGIDKVGKRIVHDIESTQANLVYDLIVGGCHSVLVYVDRTERTIEYYDSMQKGDNGFGEYKKIEKKLKEIATTFSYEFRPKTRNQELLQKDHYQCGPWILWFFKKRLEDPKYDFTTINPTEAPEMIKEFRKVVLKQVREMVEKHKRIEAEELAHYTIKYGKAEDVEMYHSAREKVASGLSPIERWRLAIFEGKIAPLSEFLQSV